jgi:hypothetical protein
MKKIKKPDWAKDIYKIKEVKIKPTDPNPWDSPYLKAKLKEGQEILRKYPFPENLSE